MSILVIGSLALDTIETPSGRTNGVLGGSATYIAIAASYFKVPVRLIGVVGADFPKEYIEFLASHKVDLEGLQIAGNGKTFRWGGRYQRDLNVCETLYTELNVFERFNPRISPSCRTTQYVCLGNIDPVLQQSVVEQMEKPQLVAVDTMNFWIERKYKELVKTLAMIDVLMVNESEARLLSREPNLIKAAKIIMAMGPRILIIKKGEHGALLITDKTIFSAPAYPLEHLQDPTGAGDAFAGGFIGWIAKTDDLTDENLKRAVLYGSTLASFCVEQFGVEGIRDLTDQKIQDRFRKIKQLSYVGE